MNNGNTLHQLLKQSVQLFPDNTALICNENNVTYSELYKLSNTLKNCLSLNGINKGDRVAIYSEKSIEFVASIFGVLDNDCAYIPLDINAPIERNKFIIKDCEISALLIDDKHIDFFKDDFEITAQFNNLIVLKNKIENLEKSPDNLAYILYTSGSTGHPKGVMYSHEGAMAFVNWCDKTFDLNSDDYFSSHAPFHFDLSIFDLFVCVKKSAALVIINETIAKSPLLLVKLINDLKITVWYSTPTILKLMTEYGKLEKHDLSHLKIILFAGEVYQLQLFSNLFKMLPNVSYFNLYGPTETNVCCFYKINNINDLEEDIPIGKTCSHYKSKILSETLEGELLISGEALMLGYWNMKSLTDEKIITDTNYTKWYKTGDIVSVNKMQEYVFKGRIDRMVKRNGYRIELDEIEKTLLKNMDITSCAVISKITKQNSIQIVSFVITTNDSLKSIIKMKEICVKLLPIYMIPDDFIFVNSFPMTSSNKIDYQNLMKQL